MMLDVVKVARWFLDCNNMCRVDVVCNSRM